MRISVLLLTLFLLACGGSSDSDTSAPPPVQSSYRYRQPPDGAGWESAHADSVRIDPARLEQMINSEPLTDIHGILIVRDQRLIFEYYQPGFYQGGSQEIDFGMDDPHEIFSCTKSITSLVMGLAVQEGHIGGADDPIRLYLPQYDHLLVDGKQELTIANLLNMRGGLDWDEWSVNYTDPTNDHTLMNNSADQVAYVLGLPLIEQPGTRFVYNSGLTITAGAVISHAVGQKVDQFAQEKLFDPMGIVPAAWWFYSNSGHIQTGGGLVLIPRDMAKLGQLILNDGVWDGVQLIPRDWLEQTLTPLIPLPANWDESAFSYSWWHAEYTVGDRTEAVVAAEGWGGQFIYVIPGLDTVVIFTGGNYENNAQARDPFRLLRRHILPAITP